MARYKDIDGEVFGRYQIIGDTGKRNKKGEVIVIARHLDSGKLYEGSSTRFRNNDTSGYIGSEKHALQLKKINRENKINGVHKSFFNNNRINSTGYKNVSYSKSDNCWQVNITFENKKYNKRFLCFEDAVLFVNDFNVKKVNPKITNKKVKFERINRSEIIRNQFVKEKQQKIDTEKIKNKIKRFKKRKGISLDKRRNTWHAYINIDGKRTNLGYYPTEQEAKAARQKAVDEQIKKLEKEMEQI